MASYNYVPEVTHLFHYPLKSCAGNQTIDIDVLHSGMRHDRQWAIMDVSTHKVITVRENPRIMKIKASVCGDVLHLSAADFGSVACKEVKSASMVKQFGIFNDSIYGEIFSPEADEWVSHFIGKPCKIVRPAAAYPRIPKPKYRGEYSPTIHFPDAAPILLINLATVRDLNTRIGESVDIQQFRPNVVIDYSPASSEDDWKMIRIHKVSFAVTTVCNRCHVITINPTTLLPHAQGEPLKTLSTYKKNNSGVSFGIYLVPLSEGTISRGDSVELIR